ncbi:MAG: tetratricopeptide repeat protein [Methylophilaceae bacterium]|nr:hypothetical protein [Methyloradius sp.]
MPRIKHESLIVAMLTLTILAVYWQALSGAFQFDDYNVIVDYSKVHSLSSWLSDSLHGLRPLLKLTYTLNWLMPVGNSRETGFHLLNLLIHLGCAYLIYRLVLRMPLPGTINKQATAILSSLLFVLHPANTEAVTYISGRSSSLMTLFFLASLLAYVYGLQEDKRNWQSGWSGLFFLLSLLVKETAILLPFTLLLWELCFGKVWSVRGLVKKQWVHWCLVLLAVIAFLLSGRHWHLMMDSASTHNLSTNLYSQINAVSYLVSQYLWPLHLNIDPDLPVLTTYSAVWKEIFGLMLVTLLAIFSLKKMPWLSFAIFWFILLLLPLYIFLPRLDIANDRQLYLAGWPLLVVIAMWVSNIGKQFYLKLGLVLLLIASLGTISILRNQDYQSEIALWQSAIKESPNKSRVYNNLGFAYDQAGEKEAAKQAYEKAIALDSGNWLARNNLQKLTDLPLDEPVQTGK